MRDKSENSCVLMVVYLLEIVNSSRSCFEYILGLPSPFAIYGNFYDWIFVIVNEFVKGASRATGYSQICPLVHHYASKLKENLMTFEDNIRA